MQGDDLTLEYTTSGTNGVVTMTARMGGDVLAVEKLDVLKPKERDTFLKRLILGKPGIDRTIVDAELLRIAAQVAAKPVPAATTHADELDVSRIIRPELFHTEQVSGITVPIATAGAESRPEGRWSLHLRWHKSGKRERRGLDKPCIELPEGQRLWLHPMPSDPLPTMPPGWSPGSRAAWLSGKTAPDPVDVFRRICERVAFHIEFPPESAAGTTATLALWSILTYVYPAWSAVPYLSVGGPAESGKSTLFGVLSRVVFRALPSSSMTGPALFRANAGACRGRGAGRSLRPHDGGWRNFVRETDYPY